MQADLSKLREIFQASLERYREQMALTVQVVTAEAPDYEAVAMQHQREREAFNNYRQALLTYLLARADPTKIGGRARDPLKFSTPANASGARRNAA
jgi:hypothetical protein